jgi:hypothetical protein
MTNHHITDVLASIGEAKRALDAEPQYQARIRELEHKLLIDGQTIAAREERIHALKQSEESLTAKLRSVEAERDDAGFRLLEESDRVSALSSHLRQVIGDSLKLLEVAGGEPQTLITTKALQAHMDHIAELESSIDDIRFEAEAAKADRDEAQAALQQLREAIAPKPAEPPSVGERVADPTPTPFDSTSTTPEGTGSNVESYLSEPNKWAERAPDPTPQSSTSGYGGSDPLSTTSLTPVGEVPAADPFAPKANTGSPSVSSHGASVSGNAFWPDSSNH